MHVYTDEEIEKIVEITKNMKPQESMTPTLYLTLGIFLFIAGIYIIYKSVNQKTYYIK